MAIEKVNHRNGVYHVRETQREHRVNGVGRFVPPSEIAEVAKRLIAHKTQREVAEELGDSQQNISKAVNDNGKFYLALKIIAEYGPGQIEGPLYFVPEEIDDFAWEKRMEERE